MSELNIAACWRRIPKQASKPGSVHQEKAEKMPTFTPPIVLQAVRDMKYYVEGK